MYNSRSNKSRSNARRWQIGAVAGVAVTMVGVGLGVASAAEAAPTVNCPTLNINVAVPAQAQAEVARNLEQLNTQINEANKRLANSQGEGGPNFVNNAIINPLKSKRGAVINRIQTAIGRNAPKPNFNPEALAVCTVNTNGEASKLQDTTVPPPAGAGGNSGNSGENGGGENGGAAPAAGVSTVNCPEVVVNVAVPASAQDEVTRNLELLNKQIGEANKRLANSVGEGGPNFVNNAILKPLQGKRKSTISRIETAIGRKSVKPNLNAEANSVCTLNTDGSASQQQGTETPGEGAATGGAEGGAATAATPTVNCPDVVVNVAIPAQAANEVQSNLALLQEQINEANNRLASSVGQGGPNFIPNAILNPLSSKRFAVINRIETAIGRNAAKPNLNAEGLRTCTLNQ